MFKRLSLLWTLFKGDARQLWFALRHPHAPGWLKVGTAMLVLYVLSPIDLIPDAIPFLGAVDDLVLIPLAIRWLLKKLPPHVAADAAQASRGSAARGNR